MLEHTFTSTVGGEDHLREASSIKDRTIIARFGSGHNGMFLLNSNMAAEAITQVLPASEIVVLGCL